MRRRLEASPELLAKGPEAVLYAVLDEVVDEYSPVDAGLENDIDEIEEQLFSGDPEVTRRIYDLASEVMEFQRATRPLVDMFDALERGFEKYDVDLELQRYLRDVNDHVIRIVERGDSFRPAAAERAAGARDPRRRSGRTRRCGGSRETSLAQSEQAKKISSWAAIIFAPTLVATIYGMNFTHMPELDWAVGLPVRRRADGRLRARALRHLQAPQLALSVGCRDTTAIRRGPSRGIRSRLALGT